MGTKVQFKSYIPIHNSIRNKNEHSSSSWSWCYQDNVLSGHLYDGSLLREANGYSFCDKEMLKRTMLEHEATFTKQVSELHRLYRTQKELMNELKNREKLKLCSTFQTNLFDSPMLSEASEGLRQMPHLSALSSHGATFNAMELPLKYLKESGTRYFQMPTEIAGSSIEGSFLNPKAINLPRKKFDLHLPAEVYIDIDDDTITEKQNKPSLGVANPSSITQCAYGDNNVKLSLRSKADGRINDIQQGNVSSRMVLADLNEPLKPSSYEERALTFSQIIGSTMEHEELKRHQLHSNTRSLSRDFFLRNHGQKQTVSNSLNLDKVECFQGWPSSINASGEISSTANGSHGGLCDGESTDISQLVKEKPKNCEFVLPGQSKSDKWIGETQSPDDTETSKGTSKLPNLNNSELAAPKIPHPFANFSYSDNSSISSPSMSSWRNPNGVKHISTAVQPLLSFNGYAVNNCRKADATFQCPCNPCDNVQYVDGNLKKRVKVDLSSCQNDFHQNLKQDSTSPRQTCLPSIINGKSSQINCLDNITLGNYNVPADPKCSEGLPYDGVKHSLESSWLRRKQAEPDFADIEQSSSHLMSLMSNSTAVASRVDEQKNNKKGSTSICSLLDSSSSSHVMERKEASCSPSGKRNLQFPISEITEQSVECDLSNVDIRNQVNIYSSASCMDALNSLVILPKDELPSSLSATNISTNIAPMIDVEGLLDTKVEKDITTAEEEGKKLNCNLTTANTEVDLQLTDGSHETLIREAADSLVAMSLLIGNHSHDLTCPSIPTSFDTLHWFVDLVTATEKSPHYDDDVDGLDMFEYMTLKLKEIKEDEFFYKLQENQNYDDTSTALLPPTRSQRGVARKRRQRRDFQKDILPGLASLSRHEVSEDLQSFGGIMRASGKSWKTGSSRRSTSRKASNWQARSLAITVTEVKIGSSQKEDANSKQEISTTGILGWGRTTRRCRRPRLMPGNLSVSLA